MTFQGQPELHEHADVVANITDSDGKSDVRGKNLDISHGKQTKLAFWFGLDGVPDHQLAPGESVRLAVTTPPATDTDITRQPVTVRYCSEY